MTRSHSNPITILLLKGFLLVLLLLGSGCSTTHTQFLTDHWQAESLDLHQVAETTHSSRLQVIITYDGGLSSHSAIRLELDPNQVTFWDPAGAYGLVGYILDQEGNRIRRYGKRERDIVITHIPDILTYINFRWHVGDSSVEVFEWNIPRQQAKELWGILRNETDENHPKGQFQTDTAPAFCSIAISDFLQRFTTPTITLADSYLWPHNLAEALLKQGPSKVRLFSKGNPETIFIAPRQ